MYLFVVFQPGRYGGCFPGNLFRKRGERWFRWRVVPTGGPFQWKPVPSQWSRHPCHHVQIPPRAETHSHVCAKFKSVTFIKVGPRRDICHFCSLPLSAPIRISQKARILTMKEVFESVETYYKRCEECSVLQVPRNRTWCTQLQRHLSDRSGRLFVFTWLSSAAYTNRKRCLSVTKPSKNSPECSGCRQCIPAFR